MPQARLPDINTQYIKFVNEAVNDWKNENYTACRGALYTLNGLLPEKYRVIISNSEYSIKSNPVYYAECIHCKKETKRDEIKVQKLLRSSVGSILTGSMYVDIWRCPLCKKNCKLEETEIVREKQEDPSFYKVIPEAPSMKDGLDDRAYHRKFTVWFWTAMGELAAQMAQFRDDNWTKPDNMSYDDVDGGEEND